MSINFKIFFKETLNNSVVLIRGNLLKFDWNALKESIIKNSQLSYFKSNNLALTMNDNFILELTEKFQKLDISQIPSIYNDITFSYLLEKLKAYNEKNPDENLLIKFQLVKKENLPVSNIEKYEICLKESLKSVWKNEKEKIKNKLNEMELTNREIIFLNKKLKNNNENNNSHLNTICNNCLSINFFGYRYICSYCHNYNLCYQCYKTYNHNKEHNFILFKKPIIEDDINKYDNKISPCSQIFKNIKKSFDINFDIANTGEKNLSNCYITYIKFDKNFLYCEKYIFDKFEKNENRNIKLKICFNEKDNANINFNIFEGDFRMFNKFGVPFGDILKIKVKNNYVEDN